MSLDLVEQRVLNAEPVPSTMTDTVAALVGDADASVRRGAVQCLALLNQGLAARTVAPLFVEGLDPAFDEVILTVLSKTAEPSTVPEILRRFMLPNRSRLVSQATLTACSAGLVTRNDRDALARSILATALPMRDRTPMDVELLAWAPCDDAQTALRALLEDGQAPPEVKGACARGIFASGEHLDLLSAHSGDAAVRPWALQWAAAMPTLDRLRLIAGWKPLDAGAYVNAISKIMTGLEPVDWLAADEILAKVDSVSADARIGWLARVLTLNAASESAPDGVRALPLATRRALFVRLAQLHEAEGHAEAMLTVVQAANGATPGPMLERLRAIALVANGQIGNVDAAPQPDILIDALDLVLRTAVPRLDIAQAIVDRLGVVSVEALDQVAQSRLAELTMRLETLLAQRSNADADSGG
jgi:hypothetical protein